MKKTLASICSLLLVGTTLLSTACTPSGPSGENDITIDTVDRFFNKRIYLLRAPRRIFKHLFPSLGIDTDKVAVRIELKKTRSASRADAFDHRHVVINVYKVGLCRCIYAIKRLYVCTVLLRLRAKLALDDLSRERRKSKIKRKRTFLDGLG